MIAPCGCRETRQADSTHSAGVRHIVHCALHGAAPELLAALRELYEVAPAFAPDAPGADRINAAYIAARAALAKAEGRTS